MVAIFVYLGLLALIIWILKTALRQSRTKEYKEAGKEFSWLIPLAEQAVDMGENMSASETLAWAESALEAAKKMSELADEKSVHEVEEAREALEKAESLVKRANSRKFSLNELD